MNVVFPKNNQAGLTIIEFFVVAAILAIMAGFWLNITDKTRAESRDARRVVDVEQIHKALNIYYIDHNRFPILETPTVITGDDPLSQELHDTKVMRIVPVDPDHPNSTYYYVSNQSGTKYRIIYCLETDALLGKTKGCGNTLTP